ncbi:MAG: tetratricopeptide repeat protein, partial [Acidobacteriota bacterium]
HLVDARFHLENDDLEQASRSLGRALALFPRSAEGLTLKGEVLVQEGKINEAAVLFRSAVDADPESAKAWENLGIFLMEHGSPDDVGESAAALERALELEPWRAEAAFGLGVAYAMQGRLQEAREMLELAVDVDREHVRSWIALGMLYLTLQDIPAATEALETAIWIDPDNAHATCNLAAILARTYDQRAGEYRQRCEDLSSEQP